MISVFKKDMNGGLLKGAKFKLTGEDGTTALTGYEAIPSENSSKILDKVMLSNGTYYLVETKSPDGYNLLSDKVRIDVNDGEVVVQALIDGEPAKPITVGRDSDGLKYWFSIVNSDGTALPNTGGSGTAPFYIFGTAIVVMAILTYGLISRQTSGRRSMQ